MSLALYRRYRPESFEDVVGQEHVTEPLMQALRTGRVNHAYLFSGPRGCGKTTSARILARCLNCEQGPVAVPCGECASCRDLARGGPGSLDVIEIDAASHGGVDDARDLRDRVAMSPVRDRYRVFIIDEAHMVSTQGFNALLKVVEEPPEHVKFVFATTEPDKVLQTIRSRTHHYAFRLVPPDVLIDYLGQVCETEQVPVGQGVLPLVVRAGQGSVRDSLSVLDQLIAGASEDGLDYARAVALLGYTDSALLDDALDALAQLDGAALFGVVNRVVESGHDPRRFAEDLLERLRDLILVQAMGPAADGVLRAVPQDQLERMRTQAGQLGAAELSRAADVSNLALAEMVGASSPRMHLELLAARLLLPAADDSARGLGPRLDRVERRLGDGTIPATAPVAPREVRQRAEPARPAAPATVESTPEARPAAAVPAAGAVPVASAAPVAGAAPAAGTTVASGDDWPEPTQPGAGRPTAREERPAAPSPPASGASAPAPQPVPAAPTGGQPGQVDTERMRRAWPELLSMISSRRKATWMVLQAGAGVHELADGVLWLSFSNQGTAKGFSNGQHPHVVAAAVRDMFDLTVRVEAHHGDRGPARPAGRSQPAAPAGGSDAGRSDGGRSDAGRSDVARSDGGRSDPGRSGDGGTDVGRSPSSAPAEPRRPTPPASAGRRESGDAREGGDSGRGEAEAGPEPGGSGRAADATPATVDTAVGVGVGSRVTSEVDAWGIPFGDEPPPDDVPPEEERGSGRRAARPATTGAPAGESSPPRSASGSWSEPSAAQGPSAAPSAAAAPSAQTLPAAPSTTPLSTATPPNAGGASPTAGGASPSGGFAAHRSTPTPPAEKPAPGPGRERPSRYQQLLQQQPAPTRNAEPDDDEPSPDDPIAEDSGLVGLPVVEKLLGGTVIGVEEGG